MSRRRPAGAFHRSPALENPFTAITPIPLHPTASMVTRVLVTATVLVEHSGAITNDAVFDALIGDGSPHAEIREVVHLSCATSMHQAANRV